MTAADDLAPGGTLRVAINLGNPVLAQGTPEEPRGVTVDLARLVASRIGRPLTFRCSTAARDSFDALVSSEVDLAFLADEPARAEQVVFTAPYVLIEGVFVVPDASTIRTPADVDRPGLRVGVKRGSAYDLFLTRSLRRAEVVRGDEGVEVFADLGLDAGAGIRGPVERWVAGRAGVCVVPERFMEIRQAVALPLAIGPEGRALVDDVLASAKADGTVRASLAASGAVDAVVAP